MASRPSAARRLTPGQSVDALAEAIDIIRASWNAGGGPIRHEGTHYHVVGAHPGPAPVHDVEIWLGAYKPRMLALTGAKADGWLPSMAYADIAQLPDMNAAIDRAAEAAGRRPADVRRLFNINGSFGSDTGFLRGAPRDWAEQLSELTLNTGMSAYILSVSSDYDVRRFAEEVAPAVRELVSAGRKKRAAPVTTATAASRTPAPRRWRPRRRRTTGDVSATSSHGTRRPAPAALHLTRAAGTARTSRRPGGT